MRKIIFAWAFATALASAFFAAPAFAWSLNNLNLEEFEPDSLTRMDARGTDVRVYEFTPRTAPHMTCVIVFSNSGNAPMDCFEKDRNGG